MEFMGMVSALSELSAENRVSTHGSVLRSTRSEISEFSSVSGSKYEHAGKMHARGFYSKPQKQQLAQRRLSLYVQSGDPFRPSSSDGVDQPAKLQEERVALASKCQTAPCSAPCDNVDAVAAAEVTNKFWGKHHILIVSIVFVIASVTFAVLVTSIHSDSCLLGTHKSFRAHPGCEVSQYPLCESPV